MTLSEKMIALRKQQGLSQQDLAERLGLSRQAVSRWETGAVQPTADSVRNLCQVFRVSADYLLNDDPDDPTPPRSPQSAPAPQPVPAPARKHRKWLLALAALATAVLLVLVTAVGTAHYLQWKERQPVSASDMLAEKDDGFSDGSFDLSW